MQAAAQRSRQQGGLSPYAACGVKAAVDDRHGAAVSQGEEVQTAKSLNLWWRGELRS